MQAQRWPGIGVLRAVPAASMRAKHVPGFQLYTFFSLYSRSFYCSAKGILQSRDQWKMIGRSDTGSCAREGRLGYRSAAGRTGPGPGVRCTGCGTWERGGRDGPPGQLPLSLWLSVYLLLSDYANLSLVLSLTE